MFEIVIKGKFITGVTIDDEEKAKATVKKLLEDRLDVARCLTPSGIFEFKLESIEAEKL